MIYFEKFQSQFIAAYGVGSGNAPARMMSVGHLRAVYYSLNHHYVTQFKRLHPCNICARI
jgi:hypothetical protein